MEDVLGKWLDTVSSGSWRSMCTDFWEKEKKQSQSGFIFRFSSGIVFLSVFRTGDYEMYRKNRVLACFLVLTGVIAASGTGMIKAGNFERVLNRQQVPDQIAMICNRINEDREGKEERIAADEYTASYIRAYDPSLKMAYGRRGDGAVGKKARVLYKQITSEVPDGKKTSSLADAVHCTYVVMVPPGENFVLDMVAGGYQVLDTVSPYYIFSCDKYK